MTFGLLTFPDEKEFDSFTIQLNKFLKKYKYWNKNIKYEFNDKLCICNIVKKRDPSWKKDCKWKCDEFKRENKTHYRIIFIKYKFLTYYIEICGNICIKNFLNKFDFDQFNESIWNEFFVMKKKKSDMTVFIEKIDNYLTKSVVIEWKNELKFKHLDLNSIIDFSSIIDFNSSIILFNNIKNIDGQFKLPTYKTDECLNPKGKSSETVYNKKVCDNDPTKILVDCILIKGCELADIFDIKSNSFFHNKKAKNIRPVIIQSMVSILSLKDDNQRNEYIKKLQDREIDTSKIDFINFNFVIGLIEDTKNINLKDQIALGILAEFMKKQDIPFFIDKIKHY